MTLGFAGEPASAEISPLYDTYVQCDPLWSPAYNVDDTDPAISYAGELDMYAAVTEARCALILDSPLPSGKLTVKAVNRKNPASSGTYVNIDYVHYEE